MPKSPRPETYFRPRNWERWQRASKHAPKWIKLHVELLDNADFKRDLTELQQWQTVQIWLLYARAQRPLPLNSKHIGAQLGTYCAGIGKTLKRLQSLNYIELCDRTGNPSYIEVEEDIEEEPLPIGNEAGEPPQAQTDDLKARVFGKGLDWLAKQSEKPSAKLRPMVGRWCRDHGDGAVLDAMIAASRSAPVDPVGWIEKRLMANGAAAPELDYDAILRNV